MTNESIGSPLNPHPVATPAERLIYASEVLLDFQSGISIVPANRSIQTVPQEDKEWAAEMGRAQKEKGERPSHPDQVIEASLHAGEGLRDVEG